jgi:hypothetical protein
MVFVIQHTQARHQAATQRKLDEIVRALPEADNSCSRWNTHRTTKCRPPACSTVRFAGRR